MCAAELIRYLWAPNLVGIDVCWTMQLPLQDGVVRGLRDGLGD